LGSSAEPKTARWTLRASVESAPAWLLAALVLLTISTFASALAGPFLHWDDVGNFVDNARFRGLGWSELRWAWTTSLNGVYQPLAWMLFELQFVLFELDAWSFHLIGVALHACVVVLVYFTCIAILRRAAPEDAQAHPAALQLGSLLAATLFAVHPLRVETVVWISCQPYLPCAAFFLLSVLAYLRARDATPRRRAWLAASLACHALALLCKAPAVSLPVVLLVLDAYPLRRSLREPGVWWEKVPFAVLSVLFMGMALWAKSAVDTLVPLTHYGVLPRLGLAAYAVSFYLVKTVWPAGLSAYYEMPGSLTSLLPMFAVAVLVLLLISGGVWRWRRQAPWAPAAWVVYLATVAPNSGLARIGMQLAADRYSYLPAIVVSVVLAGAFLRWAPRLRGHVFAPELWVVGGAAVALLVAAAIQHTATWTNNERLWQNALDRGGGNSAFIHQNLGTALLADHRSAEGLAHFDAALRLEPRYVLAREGRGLALALAGRPREAVKEFEAVTAAAPDFAEAHFNLGKALLELGELDASERAIRRCVELRPNFAEGHFAYANALLRRRALAEAIREYTTTVRLDPTFLEARHNLGLLYFDERRLDEAAAQFEAILRARPESPEVHAMLGKTRLVQKRHDEAEREFREALRLQPTLPQGLSGLRELEQSRAAATPDHAPR
jgi:protein O-mannosyl-transferase